MIAKRNELLRLLLIKNM